MGSALGFLVPWVVLGTSSLIASSRSNRDAQRVTALISGPSSSVCVSMFASVRVSRFASDARLPAICHLRSSVVCVLLSVSLCCPLSLCAVLSLSVYSLINPKVFSPSPPFPPPFQPLPLQLSLSLALSPCNPPSLCGTVWGWRGLRALARRIS